MEEQKPSTSSSFLKKIISAILIAVGIVLIVWLLYVAFSDNEVMFSNDWLSSSYQNINRVDVTNLNSGLSENENDNQDSDLTAKTRDEQRMADIEAIRSALKKYNDDEGNYPEKMEDLVTGGYLAELPKNPTPGGMDYVYTPIGALPAKYYDLAYSLETGTEELSAGDHIANPDNITYP